MLRLIGNLLFRCPCAWATEPSAHRQLPLRRDTGKSRCAGSGREPRGPGWGRCGDARLPRTVDRGGGRSSPSSKSRHATSSPIPRPWSPNPAHSSPRRRPHALLILPQLTHVLLVSSFDPQSTPVYVPSPPRAGASGWPRSLRRAAAWPPETLRRKSGRS
jgi:hypothetical protein